MKTTSRILAVVAAFACLSTVVACGGAPTDAEETGRTQEAVMNGGSSSGGGGSGSGGSGSGGSGSGGKTFSCTSYFNSLLGSSTTAVSLPPLSNGTSVLASGTYGSPWSSTPLSCQQATTVSSDSALLANGCYGGETYLLADGSDYYATTYLCPTSYAVTTCSAAASGAASWVSVNVGLADGESSTFLGVTSYYTNQCVSTEGTQCTWDLSTSGGAYQYCSPALIQSTAPSGWQFVTLTYIPPSGGRPGGCGSACKVPLVP